MKRNKPDQVLNLSSCKKAKRNSREEQRLKEKPFFRKTKTNAT